MAWQPPAGDFASAPSAGGGKWQPPAKDFPALPPSTSISGLAASFGRGAAPYALGAAAGAPFGGPAGAAMGAGIVGLEELAGAGYNWAASKVGLPHMTTLGELTEKGMDIAGIRRPQTGAERLAEEAGGIAGGAFGGITNTAALGHAVLHDDTKAVEDYIRNSYKSAIRPSVRNINTVGQVGKQDEAINSAVHTIVSNESKLKYFDPGTGEESIGRTPTNILEFSDALDQTKELVFQKFNQMAALTGERGGAVKLQPVVDELQRVAADPIIEDMDPEIAKYASARAEALANRQEYSPLDTQRQIARLNARLKAFYANPTYETATRASIDSMVANKLRQGLDETVTQMTSPGYQTLKNQYGALRQIERDVVKAALREKTKGKGLIGNIADFATADQVIRAIVTIDPHALVKAGAIKGAAAITKYLRDPNRTIKKMFEAAKKIHQEGVPPEDEPVVPGAGPRSPRMLAKPPPTEPPPLRFDMSPPP